MSGPKAERNLLFISLCRRNRGMESILDIEDDAGPVFKRSRHAGVATYGTKYSIRATNFT